MSKRHQNDKKNNISHADASAPTHAAQDLQRASWSVGAPTTAAAENAKEGDENVAEADEAAAERRNHFILLRLRHLLLHFLPAAIVGAPPALGGALQILRRVGWALRRQYFVKKGNKIAPNGSKYGRIP